MIKNIRQPFNGISHYTAAVLAVIGMGVLVAMSWEGPFERRVSLAIYGATLTVMLLSSATYHSLDGTPQRMEILRKIDHASIFLVIAGTYTPIAVNLFSGFWSWGILGIIWAIAIFGMAMKVISINKSDWIVALAYIAAGWFSVIAAGEILRKMPTGGIILLVGGGVIYTLGAIQLSSKKLDFIPGIFGYHEVWHLFVIGGAACHFALIAIYV